MLDRQAVGRVSGLSPGCSHPQEGKKLWVSCSFPDRHSEVGGRVCVSGRNMDDVALSLGFLCFQPPGALCGSQWRADPEFAPLLLYYSHAKSSFGIPWPLLL